MNRFGSNSYDNENDQYAQNQQIGKRLAENSPRPWDQHGQGNPANRHSNYPNYRPDAVNDIRYYNDNRPRNQYGGRSGENPNMPYYPQDDSYRHHDTSVWSERNDYKDNDYRYRSGHRNYWHEDYDTQYEGRHHRPHPQNFFSNIGQGLREGWNNLVHRHHPDERYNENRYDDYYNRNKRTYNPYDSYRIDQNERRNNPRNDEWHNSGPNHRDEDFFDPRNFKL